PLSLFVCIFYPHQFRAHLDLHSFPTRRSSDLNYEKSPPPASLRPQFPGTASSSPAERSAPPRSPCKNPPAAAAPLPSSSKSAPCGVSRTPRERPGTPLRANKTRCDRQRGPPSAVRSDSHTPQAQSPHSPELPTHSSGTPPSLPARAARIPRTSFRPDPAEWAASPPAPSPGPCQSPRSPES